MKKITLLLSAFCLAVSLNAQVAIFEDSFESYTDFAISGVGSWTLIDVDGLTTYGFTGVTFPDSGSAKSFQVFNSTTTVDPLVSTATSNWDARTGQKGMVCFAAVPSGPNVNDDWLISPQINLAAGNNSLSFWYKACDAAYSQEQFTVGISTTGTNPGDFTIISANPESVPPSDITWREFTYDFDGAYDGMPVYVGIHCVSADQFGFMVDDFKVDTTLGIDNLERTSISHFYNSNSKILSLESSAEPFNKIELYNLLGQNIMMKILSLNTEKINLSELSNGVYIAKISVDGKTKTLRILKQ